MEDNELCKFGILTASDRASSGEYEDISGPSIESFLQEAITSKWEVERIIVEDNQQEIEKALIFLTEERSVLCYHYQDGSGCKDVTLRLQNRPREDAPRV